MTQLSRRAALSALGTAGVAITTPCDASEQDTLVELTLAQASEQVHAGRITSTQLTNAYLRHIAALDARLNSIITVTGSEARAQASVLDAEAAAGRFRSALHGVPILLKDNIETANISTTAASAVLQHHVPSEDAEVWRRLKDAGAVLLGKTNLSEFAMVPASIVSAHGPVRNPWDTSYVAGGSSGGSAAAVAARLCAASVGTDTGGSIRIPSAYCGVVGLKPTYGLVSIRGIIPLAPSLDTCGPIARTVEDVALMLNHMTGFDRLDFTSVAHEREDYLLASRQPVTQLRVGVPRDPFFLHIDRTTRRCIENALHLISRLVADVRDVALPNAFTISLEALQAERQAVHRAYQAQLASYQPSSRQQLQDADARTNDATMGACSDKLANYIDMRRELELLRRTIDDAFDDFALVVLPTITTAPGTIAQAIHELTSPPREPAYGQANNIAFNIYGIPAISLPCGFSRSGLPVGMTIAGPRFSEGKLLALARAYEAAARWTLRRPSL